MTKPDGASSSGDLTIRHAQLSDVPGIVAVLADDTVGGHGHSTESDALSGYREAFARIMASPNDTLYVAELGGEIVGTFQTTLITVMSRHAAPDMMLESVHVRAALRGRGIGEAMVNHAITEARRRGVRQVQLTSNMARVDAHRFYERLGFTKSHAGFKMKLG